MSGFLARRLVGSHIMRTAGEGHQGIRADSDSCGFLIAYAPGTGGLHAYWRGVGFTGDFKERSRSRRGENYPMP